MGEGRKRIAQAADLESTISDDRTSVSVPGGPSPKLEIVEKELLLVKLRRADVHKRIRALRHAVAALIEVFGPAILDLQTHGAVDFPNVPYRSQTPTDVCREILRESPHPLSFGRILDLVRQRAPRTLAQFQKPGVAISNALRTLERRGEVEHLKNGHSGRWRWTKKQEPRISFDARHNPWSPESQVAEEQFLGEEEEEGGQLAEDSEAQFSIADAEKLKPF